MLHGDDSQRQFLVQHNITTLLRHCFQWLQHCSNIAMMCCAWNCRYESCGVMSPLRRTWPRDNNFLFSFSELRACLHGGVGPHVSEVTCGGSPRLTCKRDHIKMRDYMDRRVTSPKRVTSPTWGPPPPCKQALSVSVVIWTKDDRVLIIQQILHNLIHDTRHLSTHLRTGGRKATSRGFSGGKQAKKFPVARIYSRR